MELLLKLFWAFFQIGLFSIGGGDPAQTQMQQKGLQKTLVFNGGF